jgi:hypothetical protein
MVRLIRSTPLFVICQSNSFDNHCFATSLTVFTLCLMFEFIQCRASFSNKCHNLPGRAGFSRIKSQWLSWPLIYLTYFENIQNISCYLADPCYNCLLRCDEIGSWSTKICLQRFRIYSTVFTNKGIVASGKVCVKSFWLSSSCNGFRCV